MRKVVLAVVLALFLTGSGSSFAAARSHAPHKPADTQAKRAKAKPVRAASRSAARSTVAAAARKKAVPRGSGPARKSVAARTGTSRGAQRRPVSLTRTRFGRRVGRRALPAAPAPARDIRTPEAQAAEVPVAPVSRRRGSTVETASIASSAGKLPSAADAANRIAAAHTASPRTEVAASTTAVGAIPLHSSIVAMAPLRGSMESLVRQNDKTDADNLERIENDADLDDRIARGVLVPVPASAGLVVNQGLPQNRRYCRPWTASFLTDLSRAHQAQFHRPIFVSSAVRTVDYQKKLIRTNGNAAAAEGDVASPHLTGATIDIAKSGLSRREIYWMRNRLDALQDDGKIDVEEEFKQACFHITVYKSYIGAGPLHKHHRALPRPDEAGTPDAPAQVATEGQ